MKKTLLDKAYSDIKNISRLDFNDEYDMDVAAYHLQQGFEKIFKYVLERYSIKYPYTHRLDVLVNLIPDSEVEIKTLLNYSEMLELSQFESRSRYATNFMASYQSLEHYWKKLSKLYTSIKETTSEF